MMKMAAGSPYLNNAGSVGSDMLPIVPIQLVTMENMTMMKTMKNRYRYGILFFLMLFPTVMKAQYGFDFVSVEAYIEDHKTQRSLLLVRSTLEASNKLLHDYSSAANVEYKDLNVELDKYTRAFDVIDILYQSLRTSLNIYTTYETVSDRIGDYKNMLNDFNEKCLSRGNIVSTDTLLVSINLKAIQKIAEEGENLYRSVSDLILYATGAAACSTSDLLLVLNNINTSLDNIRTHLNKAYFDTWRYIQVRIGYWKRQVYRAKTKQEIVNDAFGRWRVAGALGY
jgi:hypothetical protein